MRAPPLDRLEGTRVTPGMIEAYEADGVWSRRTLVDYLRDAATAHPDRAAAVALDTGTGERSSMTYGELDATSDRIAAGLRSLGIGPDSAVSVMLPNRLEFPAVIWGVLKTGATYSGIPSAYGVNDVSFMVHRVTSRVLVVPDRHRHTDYRELGAEVRDSVEPLETVVVVGAAPAGEGWLSYERLAATPASASAALDPRALAHVGFTSGTTGEPKGVMNTHQTLDAVIRGWAGHLGHETFGTPLVQYVPSPVAHHTGFLWGVLLNTFLGGTGVYVDRWQPDRAVDHMRDEGVTFMVGAPTFVQDILNAGFAEPPSSLRTVALAGAPIPRALVPEARERLDCFVCPAWGMTEHGLGCSAGPELDPDRVAETDGTMIGHCRLRTTDTSGRETPRGVEGDLEMTGPGLFLGYYDRPDFSAESFHGEWFLTGDRAVIAADGFVELRGRTKDIVIRGGENIPVVEVETLVHRHPAVHEVAVIGLPDERLGERIAAVVVLAAGHPTLGFEELKLFLLDNGLSKHFLPEHLIVAASLSKTPSGKVKKNELRTMYSAEQDIG